MANVEPLIEQLEQLRLAALEQETRLSPELSALHPNFRAGGKNLAHYLAIRQKDVRELQRELAELGLSSLGRMEQCVVPTLLAVQSVLRSLTGKSEPGVPGPRIDLEAAQSELDRNTAALLGASSPPHQTRIMVTVPLDATTDFLEEAIRRGADVFRINCSKGDRPSFLSLVEAVRQAERAQDRSVRLLFDLTGPNPRTCSLDATAHDGASLARVSPGTHFWIACDASARERLERRQERPPVIGCTLPDVLRSLRPGNRLFYDDVRMMGEVREVTGDGVRVEVTFTKKPKLKLKPEKTLNFPDTVLDWPSLTDQDLEDLDFVAEHADMVGLSFVRAPRDVERIREELSRRTDREVGIVLKIETTEAFHRLPRLLFSAMKSARVGVMVARGDMAVELGFVRLAEAQEEILWLCEAALVPVIWATHVLENLTKTGVPSRAEVTDAAMSGRAECVMLNRGPHVLEALTFLREVLERMRAHQEKKRAMLRRLGISMLD